MQKVGGSLSRSGLHCSGVTGQMSQVYFHRSQVSGIARGQDWYSVCTLIPVAVGEHVVSDGQLLWSQQGLCITLILYCWQCLTFMLNASPFVPTSHVMLTSAEKML